MIIKAIIFNKFNIANNVRKNKILIAISVSPNYYDYNKLRTIVGMSIHNVDSKSKMINRQWFC